MPHESTETIMDLAWNYVQGVPYRVSMRWIFYKLLGDGVLTDNMDYNWLKNHLNDAVNQFYKNWTPNILTDNTEKIEYNNYIYSNKETVLNDSLLVIGQKDANSTLFFEQGCYIEIWFEPAAMYEQFMYYSQGIALRSFGRVPSMYVKSEIAKDLEKIHVILGLPIIILYLADFDKEGHQIPQSVLKDIGHLCNLPFQFIRCGLTSEHLKKYNIPDNPDKPGNYHWEALEDEHAGEIIQTSLSRFIDLPYIKPAAHESMELKKTWQPRAENTIPAMPEKSSE